MGTERDRRAWELVKARAAAAPRLDPDKLTDFDFYVGQARDMAQELAAFYSEMFGYPTRTELDDVHRAVTELRREVRAFKRASRAPRAAAESANSAPRQALQRAASAQPRRRAAKPAQPGAAS